MSFAPLALGILGAATSAVGTIAAGEATANAENYNAAVARNNAIVANQNATYAVNAGQEKAAQESAKGAAELGEAKAALSANNIDVNTGSALDVETGTREESRLDAQTVMTNAELQAYGYKTAATNFTAAAGLDEAEAAQAPIGAAIGAAGGLLSNASSLGFKWSGGTGGSSASPGFSNAGPELIGSY